MNTFEVCLTPALLSLHKLEGKVVVVIDILRATSCMVTGLAHGVEAIIPVATLEECMALGKKGHITAAERDGKKAAGFDLGNSPFSYMDENLKGKTIAVTTTNGTQAIVQSSAAMQIIVGAFLNITALANHLKTEEKPVVAVCAGWKGQVNAEDTLFAGALFEKLKTRFQLKGDGALLASSIFRQEGNDMYEFLAKSSHFKRLANLGIDEDVRFCLEVDRYQAVPLLRQGRLVAK